VWWWIVGENVGRREHFDEQVLSYPERGIEPARTHFAAEESDRAAGDGSQAVRAVADLPLNLLGRVTVVLE
jgi:hypothetical protein